MNVELRYVIILRAWLQGSYEHCVVATNFVTSFTDCSSLTLNYDDDILRVIHYLLLAQGQR